MDKKAEFSEAEAGARSALESHIRSGSKGAKIRWIVTPRSDDIDAAVDFGEGERFVRVSTEAVLEVQRLRQHLDGLRVVNELRACPKDEQLVVATFGLTRQPVRAAFR